jgi:hypothetical protein
MATQEHNTVAFVLYPGLTLLDLVGPLQVFASLRRSTTNTGRWW